MKISKWYYISITFLILFTCFFIWLFYLTLSNEFPKDLKFAGMFFTGSLTILLIIGVVGNFKLGSKYIKIVNYPITDFIIQERKNVIIVTLKDHAFAVPKHYKSKLDTEEIKVTYYFDRKKKNNGWLIDLPYLK